MRLSHKVYLNLSHKQLEIIEELKFHTTRLYNIVNYKMREEEFQSYSKNEEEFKRNWHSDYLHAHNRQQLFRKLEKDWKSFFNASKDYKKNPNKYTGKPKPPKFKNVNNNPGEIIFTKAGISQSLNKKKNPIRNILILSLHKNIQEKFKVKNLNLKLNSKVLKLINGLENINQVTIKYDKLTSKYYLNIVFEKECLENKEFSNIMAIDLGLDNLATVTFLETEESYILDGKELKSKRKYFDKEIKNYQSIRMSQTGSEQFRNTKNIKRLYKKLKDYKLNYLHQVSNQIIKLAIDKKVKTIVVGDMKFIKQNMNYNKSFVKAPILKLKELIKYKANLHAINYSEQNEAYTSGCSALDLEEVNKTNYNKNRRIKRGLFKSNENILINADVNGSLNILRKFLKTKCIPKLIIVVRDNGYVDYPKCIRVA